MFILIRCSDPRLNDLLEQEAVREEFDTEKNHAVIANVGSIKYFLTRATPEDLLEQIKLLAHHFEADRIVMLNHTDCGFYKSFDHDNWDQYKLDLRDMATYISEKLPELRIDTFILDTESGHLTKVEWSRAFSYV